MPEPCMQRVDDDRLARYIGGTLTQADTQRIRIHLEDCLTCRARAEVVRGVRDCGDHGPAAVSSEDAAAEASATSASLWSRGIGWVVVCVWALATAAYAAWELGTSHEPLLAKLIVFGGWTGFGLLFVGVLIDRLKAMKTDRYTEVRQ